MVVGPTAESARKISGGSQKYRKGEDHRKGGFQKKWGVAKWCRAMLGIKDEVISIYSLVM